MQERIRQILEGRKKEIINGEGLARAAILVPLYNWVGEPYLIFTRRTEKVNYHKGQISFPGGAYQQEDKTLEATALRESWEEIGLCPKDVNILGELDNTPTLASNYIISPFVGSIPYPYEFRINSEEVEEIIQVPITALLDRSKFRQESQLCRGKVIPVYFYEYNGQVIWGATARILKQFLELIFEQDPLDKTFNLQYNSD